MESEVWLTQGRKMFQNAIMHLELRGMNIGLISSSLFCHLCAFPPPFHQVVAKLTADNLMFLMGLKKAEADLAAANQDRAQLRLAVEKQRGPWFDEVRASFAGIGRLVVGVNKVMTWWLFPCHIQS